MLLGSAHIKAAHKHVDKIDPRRGRGLHAKKVFQRISSTSTNGPR